MSARFAVSLALALAGTWAVAASAAALEPGVHADPGSPAGKEYTAPLSALRGQASGHPTVEGQPGPLFGIGITAARGSGGKGSAIRATRARGRRRAGDVHRHTTPAGANGMGSGGGSANASQDAGTAPSRLGVGGSSATAVGLLVGAVVLGGLALGALFVVARRRME